MTEGSRLADVAERSVRRAVQILVRHVPPRGRGSRLVAIVDRAYPPTALLHRAHIGRGIAITCDLRDPVQSCVFYRGRYEPAVTDALLDELRDGDVFLDVGANIGYFSLLASRAVGPSGVVHAFEPSHVLATRLSADVRRLPPGGGAVVVHEVAALDRAADVALATSPDPSSPDGQRFVSSSEPGDRVFAVAIDSYLPEGRADVVKLDVEGAELRALHGLRRTIEACRPRLVVVESIDAHLRRFGDTEAALVELMTDLGYDGELLRGEGAPMRAFRPVGGAS